MARLKEIVRYAAWGLLGGGLLGLCYILFWGLVSGLLRFLPFLCRHLARGLLGFVRDLLMELLRGLLRGFFTGLIRGFFGIPHLLLGGTFGVLAGRYLRMYLRPSAPPPQECRRQETEYRRKAGRQNPE